MSEFVEDNLVNLTLSENRINKLNQNPLNKVNEFGEEEKFFCLTNIIYLWAEFLEDLSETKGLKITCQKFLLEYQVGLHWFIKEEMKSQHKIPYPLSTRNLYQPKGKVLCTLFRLIERCFSCGQLLYYPDQNLIIKTPFFLFFKVIQESILYELVSTIVPDSSYQKTYKNRFSQCLLAQRRSFINKLNQKENPIECSSNLFLLRETTYNFYEKAIQLAEAHDQFRKNFWTPYVKALRQELQDKKSPKWAAARVEEDKVIVHLCGKGRGQKIVSEPLW